MNARDWLAKVSDGASVKAAAELSDVPQATLNRQVGKSIDADNVVKIARAYGRPIVPELVALGIITSKEAGAGDLREIVEEEVRAARLDAMSDDELTSEMRRLIAEVDRRLKADEGDSRPTSS